MIVSSVPYEAIGAMWPKVHDFMDRAARSMPGGTMTARTVFEQLVDQRIALWVIADEGEVVGAFTTRITPIEGSKALAIDFVGGARMSEWMDEVMDVVTEYGVSQGCTHMEGYGRKGWERALKKHGFRVWYPVYRRELSDGR